MKSQQLVEKTRIIFGVPSQEIKTDKGKMLETPWKSNTSSKIEITRLVPPKFQGQTHMANR